MADIFKEIEIVQAAISNIRSAEECFRQMATIREDVRWLRAAGLLAQIRENMTGVTTQRHSAPTNRGIIVQ
jgi:hypothetical protein